MHEVIYNCTLLTLSAIESWCFIQLLVDYNYHSLFSDVVNLQAIGDKILDKEIIVPVSSSVIIQLQLLAL